MADRWNHEFTGQTANELEETRFPRADGWLRLRTGEDAALWINPNACAIAWFSAGTGLSTFNHRDDHGFRTHFAEIAFGCVQRNQTFPTAIHAGEGPEMIARLHELGMTQILNRDAEDDGGSAADA